MHTTHFNGHLYKGVFQGKGCVCLRDVCPEGTCPGGVSRGCVPGVFVQGGVHPLAQRQTPPMHPEVDTPPVNRMTDRQV